MSTFYRSDDKMVDDFTYFPILLRNRPITWPVMFRPVFLAMRSVNSCRAGFLQQACTPSYKTGRGSRRTLSNWNHQHLRNGVFWGTCVAQSVEHLTSVQVMISRVHEFEPRVRLCADSSKPGACFRFCASLSFCPSPAHALSLSLQNKC